MTDFVHCATGRSSIKNIFCFTALVSEYLELHYGLRYPNFKTDLSHMTVQPSHRTYFGPQNSSSKLRKVFTDCTCTGLSFHITLTDNLLSCLVAVTQIVILFFFIFSITPPLSLPSCTCYSHTALHTHTHYCNYELALQWRRKDFLIGGAQFETTHREVSNLYSNL